MIPKRYKAFGLYCAIMLWLLFARARPVYDGTYWDQVNRNLNLEPLVTIRLYLRLLLEDYGPYLRRHALINLAGNVVLFLPLGIFLPWLWPKNRRLWRVAAVTAGIITLVEVTQLFTLRGSCDVDDLILNVAGACLGYGLYRLALRSNRKKIEK